MMLLLASLAALAQAPPVDEVPPVQESAPGEAASGEAVPGEAVPLEDPTAEDPTAEDPTAEDPTAEEPPPPWQPVPEAQRVTDGVPVIGPWPDGWRPEHSGREGLPLLDPLTSDVLDPGTPLDSGPVLGPEPPVEMLGPFETPADATEPPAALLPEVGPTPAPPASTAPPSSTTGAPAPAAEADPLAPPRDTVALPRDTTDATTDRRHSLAEDFLPPPPRSGTRRAFLFLLLALLALLSSTLTERLQDRVRSTGLLPRLLSMLTGLGRGITVPLVLFSGLSVLPRSWSLAVPFALVALALALGWSTRELLADVFAGIVLTVERRIRTGDRIEVSGHRGVVGGLGLRSTRVTVDDGRMVTIPNHTLLDNELRVDPDSYAPVIVPVHVLPHLSVGEVRQILQELALLSPYVAPSRPPNVYRDADRREVWIVEARLVHPRYANAFRGAIVELADEEFGVVLEETSLEQQHGADGA